MLASGNVEDDYIDEEEFGEECEESEEEDDLFVDDDIMEKDSGSEEDRLKHSRQFKANLDQLFTAVYDFNEKKQEPQFK